MIKESRVKKSLLNARVNLICYFASLLVAFFTRKIFLDQLGTEFLGFTNTLQSLLGFLNLAELGVGIAIGYVLYEPLFDNNKEKINEIISVFGYIYRWIGFLILGIGLILSAFLPLIFPNTSFSWSIIYVGFYSFLASSLLGYFVNYKQTLLSADQRNYEITGYFQAVISTKMLVQMILAIYVKSCLLFLIIEIIFSIIFSCILTYRINKIYPWLESDIKLGRQLFKKYPEIGLYAKQLFVHKIASFVQFQITPVLIYSYASLPIVALYGNYTLITQKLQGLIGGVLDSTWAGVGNLISEKNNEKIYETFKELFAIRFLVVGIFSACVFQCCSHFITVWLGSEYVLSQIIVRLVTINFFLVSLRNIIDQFINGFGLFYDVWAPIAESVIFIVAAIVCGSIWGLAGVLCGPIISTVIIIYLWKPYFLFNKGLKKPFSLFVVLFLQHLTPIIVAYFLSDYLFNMLLYDDCTLNNSLRNWLTSSMLFTFIMLLSSSIAMYAVSPYLRNIIQRFVEIRNLI